MTRRNDPVCLIGAGGHALVVRDAAIAAGRTILGYFDDRPDPPLAPLAQRLATIQDLLAGHSRPPGAVILCVGDLAARRRILGAAPPTLDWTSVLHPSCIISPEATIAPGVFIGPLAVINAQADIGPHAIINTGAIVEHDCSVGENAHIAPRATLAGAVRIGRDTLMGVGSIAIPSVTIGASSMIGAGAVVVRDLPDRSTALGVPARPRPTPDPRR